MANWDPWIEGKEEDLEAVQSKAQSKTTKTCLASFPGYLVGGLGTRLYNIRGVSRVGAGNPVYPDFEAGKKPVDSVVSEGCRHCYTALWSRIADSRYESLCEALRRGRSKN